jgi:putative PEP-CTERM system histidine kinase
LQLLFFLSAGAVLFYGLFSVPARRRLKVFIAKHFYRNRYDYREEWLRLIETLAGGSEAASLPERSVKALAEIIGSSRGELWLADRAGRRYEPFGAWGMSSTSLELPNEDALVRFLSATRWVVDTKEYVDDPEKYSNAFASDLRHMERPAIFVPLFRANALSGIVRLERPPGLGPLSYEDHDLLKTAGQQVAIFLEQERAQEELSETRQFEAFSRLTAFLMHDLKNLIAQQELVVGNAQRFKHRPEFIEDAVRTIEAGVQRMKKVLERLQSAGGHDHTSLVNVEKVLQEACAACADREPVPRLREGAPSVRVAMDRDKLSMAVTHAIRNAQDATRSDGRIELRLSVEGALAWIEVEDDGSGMDPDFVRDRLFKPFHSTKGAKGMGIGAYQIRETLRAAGGNVEVSSEVGKGTTVRMAVPLAPAVDAPAGRSAA